MTRMILGLALVLGLSGGYAVSTASAAATTQPTTQPAGKWVCPMGCESSNHPGKCSKCGMELKKQKQQGESKSNQNVGKKHEDKQDNHDKH